MNFLRTGPDSSSVTVVLAHGAGAAMDSRFMNAFAEVLGGHGLQTIRFEFAYMAARRTGGSKKPPPRAEAVMSEYLAVVDELAGKKPLVIGGKSMGGRVASMVADDLFRAGKIIGLTCLGYPFHPPGRPERLRTAHLRALATPTLICQGTRDPFGAREEIAGYALSTAIKIHWLEDGDHDFRTGKGSTQTAKGNLLSAVEAVVAWTKTLVF